jgi:hypothetical protein
MSKKQKNAKRKRDLEQYPALNPRLNAKTRYEVLDMDYLKKLSHEELDYLNRFMGEYVSGAFKKDNDGEYSEQNLHKTNEERKECYNRNNTRNRCALTIAIATGNVIRTDDITSLIDSLTDADSYVENEHALFDEIFDKYKGDVSELNKDILKDMYEDYLRIKNPKNKKDRELAESNYGLQIVTLFENIEFNEE